MPTAIELLSANAEQDKTFVVDSDLRTIIIPPTVNNLGVESDDDVLTIPFTMPAVYCGVDLSTFVIRIHFVNANAKEDVYEVEDATRTSDGKITFSWLIGRQVTSHRGLVSFNVCLRDVERDTGKILREFNTTIASLPVLEGLETDEAAIAEYTNILEQWHQRIFGAGEGIIDSIKTEGATQVEAVKSESEKQQNEIEAKGAETLKTIPDDYTKVYQMAEEALRTKSDAIAIDVEGESISVSDASDDYLLGLRLFGKTTQADIPSPENPQELVNADNANLIVRGKNILPETSVEFTRDLYMSLGFKFPIDRYSFSAVITSTDTDTDACAVMFYDGEEWVDSIFIPRSVNGERVAYTKTVEKEFDTVRFYAGRSYNMSEGDTCSLVDMQLERADKATDFERYSTCSMNVARTLCSIPVTSGSNYTDANGQQWICDEADFELGVYTQRVGGLTLDHNLNWYYNTDTAGKEFFYTSDNSNVNAKAWETRLLCSHTPAIGGRVAMDSDYWTQFSGTGAIRIRHKDLTSLNEFKSWLSENVVKIYYVLATPVETELTSAELNAYKALRTNKPNTVIQNDSGAYMKVTYAADTLTFLRDHQPGPTNEQVKYALNDYADEHGIQIPSDEHINELIDDKSTGGVKTVNGVKPDNNGNVTVEVSAGGSYLAQLEWNESYDAIKIENYEFAVTMDMFNDQYVLSDDDFKAFTGILQSKIVFMSDAVTLARIYHVFDVQFDGNGDVGYVTLSDSNGTAGAYNFCSRSYQQANGGF